MHSDSLYYLFQVDIEGGSLIPPKEDNICDEWTKCYAVFYKVFEDIKEEFSRKKLINYLHLCDKRLLMCNACKSKIICSFKDFFHFR